MADFLKKLRKTLYLCLGIALLGGIGYGTYLYLDGNRSFIRLYQENQALRASIDCLTSEEAVAYLKVVGQELEEDQIRTKLKFVRIWSEENREVREEQFVTIKGDEVHIDAFVVTFNIEQVKEGKARSLFIWHRLYDAKTAPEEAVTLTPNGEEPTMYRQFFKALSLKDRLTFWEGIWELSNAPSRLQDYGIRAVYGTGIYQKVVPGNIYELRMNRQGQITPIVHPEI